MKNAPLPHDESQRLEALYALEILDTPKEERFDRLTRIAQSCFNVPMVLVTLVDKNRQWFKSCQGLDLCETNRDVSICAHTILSPDIFLVSDTLEDPRFADNPLVSAPPHIRFYAGAPIHASSGERVGVLCIIDTIPRMMSSKDLQILRDLADCVEHELLHEHPAPTSTRSTQ